MTKEIPILYSTAMAKAKVEVRKTQTRRVINPQPDNEIEPCIVPRAMDNEKDWGKWLYETTEGQTILRQCPYGQRGDLLWGRESWCHSMPDEGYFYKADFGPEPVDWNWKPSIHMPKAAARIWDQVISIRVERVADISEADCIAEGIEIDKDGLHCYDYLTKEFRDITPFDSYQSLWQLLNGTPKPTKKGYIVYPFDDECGEEFEGLTTWKGKPLTVVVNPWVWIIRTKQLSVTGKPV